MATDAIALSLAKETRDFSIADANRVCFNGYQGILAIL